MKPLMLSVAFAAGLFWFFKKEGLAAMFSEENLSQMDQDGRSQEGAASGIPPLPIYSPARLSATQTEQADLIVRVSDQAGLDPSFMLALALTESSLRPDIIGDDGKSIGLFQLQISTARAWQASIAEHDLRTGPINAGIAATEMRFLMDRYPNRSYADYAEAWTLGGHGRFDLGRRNPTKRIRMTAAIETLGLTLNLDEVP